MTHLPIWFLSEIAPETCDEICQEFGAIPSQAASMGIDGEVVENNHRNTTVRFAPKGHPFERTLVGIALKGNEECKWHYEVNCNEAIQFAEYGPEQHYNWHTDTFALSGKPQDRKLTVVCLLNDPSEFTGGEFQMRLYSEYTAPLKKGSVIAFPSILEHRVLPVLSGVRKSATVWMKGPRFK